MTKNDKPLLFVFDLETTGLNRTKDRICEIAWVVMDWAGKFVAHDKQLIDPTITIPQEATEVHGIRNSDVLGAPKFADYAPVLIDVLNEYDPWICGFSNENYDNHILENEFERINFTINIREWPGIDGRTLFVKTNPRDLEACANQYIGPEKVLELQERYKAKAKEQGRDKELVGGFHDAMFDTVVTALSIVGMLNKHKEELPEHPEELLKYLRKSDPDFIDIEGKFKFNDNDQPVINFGKHRGMVLQHMAEAEPGYLKYILEKDFPKDVQNIARDALHGKFPSRE